MCCAVDPWFQNYGLASQLLARAAESIVEDMRMSGVGMVRLVTRTISKIYEGYGRGEGLRQQES